MEDVPTVISTVDDVDPDGDVYLVLPGKEMRVSSKVLSVASTVFKALLSPKFLEGQALSSQLPGRVALPDDDAEAMLVICKVLHHCYHFSIPNPKLEFMVKVAIASDKYDCTAAMSQWSSVQLRGLIRRATSSTNQGKLLLTSYVLQDYQGFMQITKLMCYSPSESSILKIFSSTPYGISEYHSTLLPKGITGKIARTEWEIKKTLLSGLEGILVPFSKKPQSSYETQHSLSESVCDRKRLYLFIRLISERELFPTANAAERYTVDGLLKQLRLLVASDSTSALICSKCGVGFIDEVNLLIDQASKAFLGLCLDCVNRGEEGDGSTCQIPHEGYLGLKE